MVRLRSWLIALAVLAFLVSGTLFVPSDAQGGLAPYRTRNQHLGVSGGNVNDRTSRFCCSGTLGALVTDGTTQYILSNNHVMGRSGGAVAGEDISQPGMIDANCAVTTVVADFTANAPLNSNVDASIAQLRPGQMDSTGFIEGIGVPSSAVLTPTVGLSVTKSGRTTGNTTGTVTSINTSVSVQYQQNCGSGKKSTFTFTNQVVVGGSGFSAGGDSGSLILSNSGKNPVALLFAGSSTSTIGNPVGQVLDRLGTAINRTLSFVGSGGGGGGNSPTTQKGKIAQLEMEPVVRGFGGIMPQLPPQAADRASAALENYRANIMATPGVVGVGVGATSENDIEPAIVIYVDRTSSHRPFFAPALDGIAVRIVHTDPFVAF